MNFFINCIIFMLVFTFGPIVVWIVIAALITAFGKLTERKDNE